MTSQILPDVARLIPIAEAARRLKVHPKTIRRAIRDGRLTSQSMPFDRRIFVDADEVARYREARVQLEGLFDEEEERR